MMTVTIADRLTALGYDLPTASVPVASYASTVRSGDLLFVSGQISYLDGRPGPIGRVGAELSLAEGRTAAEAAGLGLLAHLAAATDGRVDSIKQVVRLGVFVSAASDFVAHSEVANGASELVVAVFGGAGRHARTAVGVSSLPRGVVVEIDAVVELATGQ